MGEAVTQAGAVSVAAAFFRQQMAACARIAENPPASSAERSHEAYSSEASYLRFPLGVCHEEHVLVSAGDIRELVISRGGAGPEFSPEEKLVCARAAALLDQALWRIRLQGALVETKTALEGSLRGMEEASTVVAVMAEGRKQRVEIHEQERAVLRQDHERALAAAGEELLRSREEVSELRRRLEGIEFSVSLVASAASDLCRVAAIAGAEAKGGSDCLHRETVVTAQGSGDEEEAKMIALVEGAARRALRCAFARVEKKIYDANFPAAAHSVQCGGRERSSDGFRQNSDDRRGVSANVVAGRKQSVASFQVPVPLPQRDAEETMALSVRSEDKGRIFGVVDNAMASALAACLGTAILALRAGWRLWELAKQANADREVRRERERAIETATAANTADARCRAERAAAGMRALITVARESKAQAESAAAGARRAKRQTEALWHLLSGLYFARRDHARVAAVVTERAAAAVPACERAALLTSRRDRRREKLPTASGDLDQAVSFSPDPRAWANAACGTNGGLNKERGDGVGRGREWSATIERAAEEAVAAGRTVCVHDRVDGLAGNVAPSRRVFCFSPLSQSAATTSQPERNPSAERDCENVRPPSDDPIFREGQTVSDEGGDNPAVFAIAWVLRVNDAPSQGQDQHSGRGSNISGSRPIHIESIAASSSSPLSLPKRVSTAIEGVGLAIGLALFPFRDGDRSFARRDACAEVSVRLQKRSRDHDARLQKEREFRDAELERLRRGTSALAARVQTLERKAVGLRASEARTSLSLARAEADAMGAKGELQLVMLERDRLARRLNELRTGEGKRPPGREKTPWAARPSGNSGSSAALSSAVDLKSETTRFISDPYPAKSPSAGDGLEYFSSSSSGDGKQARVVPLLSSPRNVRVDNEAVESASQRHGGTGASSEALQRMASVHARLADSLRRGFTCPAALTAGVATES